MQNLQEKASEWIGVKQSEAFAIDNTNLFEKLGIDTFVNLSTNFYNRVYDDEEEWFRSILLNSKKEDAIQNQYEFFVQQMGGPPLYSNRKVMWTRHPYFVVALTLGFILCINGGSDSGSFISKDKQLVRSGTVKTFRTTYGDIVDCVDVYKQPAFDHPLLKNHVLQWKPVVAPKQLDIKPLHERSEMELSSFVSNEVSCPINTIPIRRTTKKEFHAIDINADQNDRIYRFAVLKLIHPKGENFHGALTYISLNNPRVDKGQNSGASIWIGSDLSDQKNFLKAGWMVYPEVYGDSQTRYSIYWTGDGYHKTGCYDIQCPGFVQVDRTIVLGSPFLNISTHGKNRFDQYFYIYQDPTSQDWWLMTANDRHAQPVGYWPKEIVPRLRKGATILHFGGSTMTQSGQDFPMMGDGNFPDGNPLDSGYFRLIRYANKTNDLISPQPSSAVVYTDNPRCYLLSYEENGTPEFQHALYLGGPGGRC